jgi:hypothetical protein
MPSAADLIFIALLGALVFTPLSVRLVGDAGIGWHIRTGQQIVAAHAIPHVDSFSSTMAGKPWFAWEWLYDLVVGRLEAAFGLNGVVWFTAVVIAGVFAWMFSLLIDRGTNLPIAVVALLLAMSASMIHFLARPHVVSWLFTLAWFWILDWSERRDFDQPGGSSGRWLWALPLLMLVWVNVHGGFLMGFVLLGIFLAGAAWTWFRAKENRIEEVLQKIGARKRVRNLGWIALLSAAASLVNPYGGELHLHVYRYLSDRFLMDHIEEFRSPDFHGIAPKCFLVLLLITLMVLAVRGRELRMSQGLTVLFAVYAGLYASRNIPVSSILLVMVAGPLAAAGNLTGGFFQRMSEVEVGMRGHLWPIFAVIVTLGIAANDGRVGASVWMDAHFDPQRMPVEAVNYLEKERVKGPVLSPDYWGGYLIYRLYPKSQVVVDDRHDLYGEEFFKSYLKMVHVEPGWEEFLWSHEAGCVLLRRDAALADRLAASRGWKQIYADDVAIAFVRDAVNP